jgi:catechol 2,3-dioxygenase-like lactoylglutathione lyase family enzyme
MAVRFNHTIVAARDKHASARFYTELFGVGEPEEGSFFVAVTLDDDVVLLFADAPGGEVVPQHYAFLVGDGDFDAILAQIQERGLEHWADPSRSQHGINTNHGGRGVYFLDPGGNFLEAITRPYG